MKMGSVAKARPDRIVSEILNGTGRVIDKPSDVGGWPVLETGTAYTDTDKDGMPDDWETARGLNPNDPADGSLDRDSDGYTNVEEFLNSLMADLYTQDVPFPEFNSKYQKFLNIFYDIFRALTGLQKFLKSLLVTV